jgi:hypothetical protein
MVPVSVAGLQLREILQEWGDVERLMGVFVGI